MTESEAKAMLEAYMECDKRKNKVAYEEQCHEDCDNCNLCYAQGTVGEHREAVNMAIKSLEKQIPKKNKNDNCRCKACGTYNNFIVDNLFNPKGHPIVYCWNCGQAIDWSEEE